jgi:hypothetical protein
MKNWFNSSHSLKHKRLLWFCVIQCCLLGVAASATNLTALEETKQGNWSYGTMKNDDSGREFCFAESTGAQSSTLRIVIYKADKDWFIEAMNNDWNMRDGSMSFSLDFDNGYSAVLKGKSEGDALSYDLLDLEMTLGLFGLISKNERMQLKNSNGGHLEYFSLVGSREAIEFVSTCAGF